MDVYEPGTGLQIHDLNPSDVRPHGLFWTIAVPGDGIDVNPGRGSASIEANNVPIFDYGTGFNQLFGDGSRTAGTVSYKVKWSGVNDRVDLKNTDPVYGGFTGEFVRNSAQMEWTATVGDYTFVSDPLLTSFSSFAEIGHERNGSFFP